MNLLKIYSEWASQEHLTPTELGRVLALAMEKDDWLLLRTLLRQDACTEEMAQGIRDSMRPGALSAWVNSEYATEEAVAELCATADVSVLSYILKNDRRGLSDRSVRILWKRNDASLRLGILRSEGYRKAPESWIKWLLKARPFPGYAPHESLVFQSISENSTELAWRVAEASEGLDVLSWVYGALPENRRYDHHDRYFQDRISSYLSSGGSDEAHLAPAAEAVLDLLRRIDRSRNRVVVGSRELETAILLVEALPLDHPVRDELHDRVVGSGSSGPTPTREMLLEDLRTGALPAAAVGAAMGSKDLLEDELWLLVAPHEALTPSQARELLAALDPWHTPAEFELVLSSRSSKWTRELARLLWESINRPDEQVKSVVNRLTEDACREFVTYQADRGSTHVTRLVALGLLPSVAVSRLPITELNQMDREVRRAVFALTREELSDVPARWEIFETLSQEFTGTYGELLESAKLLAEQRS